jgi:hypothetical protein
VTVEEPRADAFVPRSEDCDASAIWTVCSPSMVRSMSTGTFPTSTVNSMRHVAPAAASTTCIPAGGAKRSVPKRSFSGVTVNGIPAQAVPIAPDAVELIVKTRRFGRVHARDCWSWRLQDGTSVIPPTFAVVSGAVLRFVTVSEPARAVSPTTASGIVGEMLSPALASAAPGAAAKHVVSASAVVRPRRPLRRLRVVSVADIAFPSAESPGQDQDTPFRRFLLVFWRK